MKAKGEYLLQKYPGKGGWTYAYIPEIKQNKNNPFGWVTVSGTIDGHKMEKIKLMPAGEGRLFLSFNAKLRKKLQKEAGDTVMLDLAVDESPYEIPEEINLCLENESATIRNNFNRLKQSEKKAFIDWIYAAQKEATRVERIVKMIEKLAEGKKFYE